MGIYLLIKNYFRHLRSYWLIRRSGLFDADYYLKIY